MSGTGATAGTATAGTAISAETQPVIGDPGATTWKPAAAQRTYTYDPPPEELRKFVRSLSVLGVPVHEIARRIKDKTGVKSYQLRRLYRDFREDLLPKMKRGPRGKTRVRLIEKPDGWKPLYPGAVFSYADVLAILQSDLDSRDLGVLYGVRDDLIYRLRRGETRYTKYLLPKLSGGHGTTPVDMAYRAMVTADLAADLVKQMREMVSMFWNMVKTGEIADPMKGTKTVLTAGQTLYRLSKDDGKTEERIVFTKLERRAAMLDGFREEKP